MRQSPCTFFHLYTHLLVQPPIFQPVLTMFQLENVLLLLFCYIISNTKKHFQVVKCIFAIYFSYCQRVTSRTSALLAVTHIWCWNDLLFFVNMSSLKGTAKPFLGLEFWSAVVDRRHVHAPCYTSGRINVSHESSLHKSSWIFSSLLFEAGMLKKELPALQAVQLDFYILMLQ
jgi:hypothetical protein